MTTGAALRPANPDDHDALCAICLKTGDAGRDATQLYRDPMIIGAIYAAPYVAVDGTLAFVAEDRSGVIGYVAGAADTRAFEARLEADWWPPLRQRYLNPAGEESSWSPDERRARMIHQPVPVPAAVVAAYPANVHMNLLPEAQGRGIGTRLLAAWIDAARQLGIAGVHAGVNAHNEAGLRFWTAKGFEPVYLDRPAEGGGTIWCGRPL